MAVWAQHGYPDMSHLLQRNAPTS